MCKKSSSWTIWLDGFYSKSLYTVNINIVAPEIGVLEIGPKTQNGNYLENGTYVFETSLLYGDHTSKQDIIRKVRVHTLRAQTISQHNRS
jgi:hypothetical protein